MCGLFLGAQARGERNRSRRRLPGPGHRGLRRVCRCRKREVWLSTADELEVHLGQQLAVEERAMLFACRIVDSKTAAERVQRRRRARELSPGYGHGIDG